MPCWGKTSAQDRSQPHFAERSAPQHRPRPSIIPRPGRERIAAFALRHRLAPPMNWGSIVPFGAGGAWHAPTPRSAGEPTP